MRHAAKVFVAFAVLLAVASAQPDGAEGEKTFLLSKLANKFHHLTGPPTGPPSGPLLFLLEWVGDVSNLDLQVDAPDQTIGGFLNDCIIGEIGSDNECGAAYPGDFDEGPPGTEAVLFANPKSGEYKAIVRYYEGSDPALIRVSVYAPGVGKVILTKPEFQLLGTDDDNSVDLYVEYPGLDWGTNGNGDPANRGAIFSFTLP